MHNLLDFTSEVSEALTVLLTCWSQYGTASYERYRKPAHNIYQRDFVFQVTRLDGTEGNTVIS